MSIVVLALILMFSPLIVQLVLAVDIIWPYIDEIREKA